MIRKSFDKIPLMLVLVLCLVQVLSQESIAQDSDREALREMGITRVVVVKSFESAGLEGHPYLFENYMRGSIIDARGNLNENIMLRYIPYNDSLQIRSGNQELILYSSRIRSFTFHDGKLERTFSNGFRSPENNIAEHNFLEVLHQSDKGMILLQHGKRFVRANYSAVYDTGNKYDQLLDTATLYTRRPNGVMDPVRMNRRRVLALFGDHSGAIRNFVNQNNLSFSDTDHLLRMVKYYDSLVNKD